MNAYLEAGVKWNSSRYGYMLPRRLTNNTYEEGVHIFNSMEGLMDVYTTVQEMVVLDEGEARNRWENSVHNKILIGKRSRNVIAKEAEKSILNKEKSTGKNKKTYKKRTASKNTRPISIRVNRRKKGSTRTQHIFDEPMRHTPRAIAHDTSMISVAAMNVLLETNARMLENTFTRIMDRFNIPGATSEIVQDDNNEKMKKIFFAVMEKGVSTMLQDQYSMSSRRVNSRNLYVPFDREVLLDCLKYSPAVCSICESSSSINTSCWKCELVQPRTNFRKSSPCLIFAIKSISRLREVLGTTTCVRKHANNLVSYLAPWAEWQGKRYIIISVDGENLILFLPVSILQDETSTPYVQVPHFGSVLGSLHHVALNEVTISSSINVVHQGGGKVQVTGELCVFDEEGRMTTGKNYT